MTAVAWFIGDVICWVHSDEQLDCTHLGDQTANETDDRNRPEQRSTERVGFMVIFPPLS